jgi:aminomethyltransferase
MAAEPLRTALAQWHADHHGRMVDFAGWLMPVQYSGIVEEHHAVRRAAGLFDIAHMGRLEIAGPDAEAFLNRVLTIDVTKLRPGQIRYSLVCNESGGVLDDVLLYHQGTRYLLVVNASNRDKIVDWLAAHQGGFDATVTDQTFDRYMLAVQGPAALAILNPLTAADLAPLKYYRSIETTIGDVEALVSRTGYTGEDGFEVIVPIESAEAVWETVFDEGRTHGLLPCGLGCRDTLRLEAGMPLYGHELDEQTDPVTAGLGFAAALDTDFIGQGAIAAVQSAGPQRVRVGLQAEGRRVAREGTPVVSGEREVGRVTSGTFSPTLERPIAMAYVESAVADGRSPLAVDIRGRRDPVELAPLPFYRRAK